MATDARAATLTVALIGNPNTGKSTLFGALVGMRQRVGNFPGVTVEKKAGRMEFGGRQYELIDLPGVYSLSARAPDAMVTVDVLLGRSAGAAPVDAVLCVVDASNLERNLYLVSQTLELGVPTLIALNMIDVAENHGLQIDVAELSRTLGAAVTPVAAHRGVGIAELRSALAQTIAEGGRHHASPLPEAVLRESEQLEALVAQRSGDVGKDHPRRRFLARRLLLGAGSSLEKAFTRGANDPLTTAIEAARERIALGGASAPDAEVTARYAWAQHAMRRAVRRVGQRRASVSDRLDRVLTNRLWGSLILFGAMVVMFQAVFSWSQPLADLIGAGIERCGAAVEAHMAEGALRSLLVDGVLEGVGGVLAFLPQIGILFFFIAILEDCGYLARGAFLMDRLMARVGLSGKSFVPMLSSFACAVPGIMAARVVENERDRLTTILVAPLLTCSARLPVYALLIAAFVPARSCCGGLLNLQGLTLFALYALGIVTAVVVALLLKRTLLRGKPPLFFLELPSYKRPSLRTALHRVWERGVLFVQCAGTLILAVSVLVWAAMYYPRLPGAHTAKEQQRASVLGRLGGVVEPAVRPLGWDWRIGCAVIASFPAREVVVATLGVIFDGDDNAAASGEGNGALSERLRQAAWDDSREPLFTLPTALSIMVFFALCAQCTGTLAIIRRETNSWRWPLFVFAYMTALAYAGAFVTYQSTVWLGWS